jgi:hypothetical protein
LTEQQKDAGKYGNEVLAHPFTSYATTEYSQHNWTGKQVSKHYSLILETTPVGLVLPVRDSSVDSKESKFTAVDTMAATACTILVLLNSAAFTSYMLVFRHKIICMTCSTEGRILRVGPGKRWVDAVTVTATATQIPSVVTRIVALRVVTEAGRRPAGCYMTGVALERRVYVAQRFGCRIATIHVTLVAVTGAAGIMNPDTTYERGGGVAG